MNHRALRRSMGTRTQRRAFTKTRAIPGSAGARNGKFACYTTKWGQKPSPKTRMKELTNGTRS